MTDEIKILRCSCAHKFQDERYGPKMRVMNPTRNESGTKQLFRCTVCGVMRTITENSRD